LRSSAHFAGTEQRFAKRLMTRLVFRRQLRGFGPVCNRVGKSAKLPQHLTEVVASIDTLRSLANRATKTKHRVDRAAAMLMIAAARQPIRRPFQRHVLSRAFSASTTGRGVTRYNVRPSTV